MSFIFITPLLSFNPVPSCMYALMAVLKLLICDEGIFIKASVAAVNLPCASTVYVGTVVALP